jgi:5'-nucleotidase
MNILLTNDDGIDSEGLQKLATALRKQKRHEVYVLAPDANRSGVSHSIAFMTKPMRLVSLGSDMWSCSGNPADCVIMALLGALHAPIDLVVSGINAGANMGTDIIYSGTAAAARQASLFHVPAIALSLDGDAPYHWDEAAAFAVEHLDEFVALWKDDIFVNVNIPNTPKPDGMARTFPAIRNYHDSIAVYDAPDGNRYCFADLGDVTADIEAGSDHDAVLRNLVSVSPVYIHPVVRADLCEAAPAHAVVAPRKRA